MSEQACKKRGPYFPVGDTEWTCTTHDGIELIRSKGWGDSARREDMVCPIGESERIVWVVTWSGYVQGVRRSFEEAEKVVEIRCPGAKLKKLSDGLWVSSHERVRVEVMATE